MKKQRATPGALLRLGCTVMVFAAFGAGGAGVALGATGSAASDQYKKPAKVEVANASESLTPPTPAATTSSGTLPFTGVSLIWPAVGAVVLVGLGLGLRRRESKN